MIRNLSTASRHKACAYWLLDCALITHCYAGSLIVVIQSMMIKNHCKDLAAGVKPVPILLNKFLT